MYAIAFLQSAHRAAHQRYLPYRGPGKTVLYKDEVFGVGRVHRIERVRHVAGLVLDKIIFRVKTGIGDDPPRIVDKTRPLGLGHVEVERLEKPAVEKAAGQVGKSRVRRMSPAFYAEKDIRVI